MKQHFEYGLKFDCESNGCSPQCPEDGEVLPRGRFAPTARIVNRHAVKLVHRTVTATEWEDGPEF